MNRRGFDTIYLGLAGFVEFKGAESRNYEFRAFSFATAAAPVAASSE
jgi:hypothetical protein